MSAKTTRFTPLSVCLMRCLSRPVLYFPLIRKFQSIVGGQCPEASSSFLVWSYRLREGVVPNRTEKQRTWAECVKFSRVFSERELTFMFAICCRPSVCRLSVCLSSVTLVYPTQPIVIFGNISMAFGSLAIHWHLRKILRRSSQGNPSAGGVKHKRGSQI